MNSFLTLKSVNDILDLIGLFEIMESETKPLADSLGRVLAERFPAPEDLPGFDRSTMDGFAVRAKDVFGASEGQPAALDLIGECPMGETPSIVVGPGQAARIWTGGMLPQGSDAVVMLEYSRKVGENMIELTKPVAPQENIITSNEDAEKGEELLPAGRILRPQELGLLAALGQTEVLVRQRPKVAVISSGDEVVSAAVKPKPGQVRDINSHTLAALALAAGAEAKCFGLAGDTPEELRSLVLEALDWADVVLVSGGSSAGQRDFTVKVFASIPEVEILAHGVAISPGKPLIMAKRGQQSLWGLPGHAASALVCAEVFIRPLLKKLLGVSDREVWRRGLRAVLSRPVASAQGRRDYIRVRLDPPEQPDGHLVATPVMGKSGLITTLVMADALVVCPEDLEGLDAGQLVDIHLSL